jgi:hypothetical protein
MSIITAALTNRTHRCFLFIVYLFLAMPNAGAQDRAARLRAASILRRVVRQFLFDLHEFPLAIREVFPSGCLLFQELENQK